MRCKLDIPYAKWTNKGNFSTYNYDDKLIIICS